MDFNSEKYFVENSDALTEAEKIQFAKDLIELERQGVIEWRDGAWQLPPASLTHSHLAMYYSEHAAPSAGSDLSSGGRLNA
jgi:hypothetical protein